jgi:hypothetical protein
MAIWLAGWFVHRQVLQGTWREEALRRICVQCMFVYMYTYMLGMYVCICLCMHVCTRVYMRGMYVCMYVCKYVCMYVFTYITGNYVCMEVCIYACVLSMHVSLLGTGHMTGAKYACLHVSWVCMYMYGTGHMAGRGNKDGVRHAKYACLIFEIYTQNTCIHTYIHTERERETKRVRHGEYMQCI